MIEVGYLKTPLGVLKIRVQNSQIVCISFTTHERNCLQTFEPTSRIMKRIKKAVTEYFSGRLQSFNLPVNPIGTTFQKSVWRELRRISYGQTCSYAEVAKRIGHPKAIRAVANAIANNPICIIIPCHRIILSDGRLGGFVWGIARKKKLLEIEKSIKTNRLTLRHFNRPRSDEWKVINKLQ